MIDANQLENALLNLAVNARDAMPGGGKLVVRTLSRGNHVLLTVSDTGIGMSEETQRRAFEPFFTTKRQGEGTGLGLAQVASFIAQAEGSLDVVSSEGKGTTIRLSFPRLPEGTAIARDAMPETGVFNGMGRHAMVVEDQQGVREHVAESLRQLGFEVATAAGRHGRASPRRCRPYGQPAHDRHRPARRHRRLAGGRLCARSAPACASC